MTAGPAGRRRARWRAAAGLVAPLLRGTALGLMQRRFYAALYAFVPDDGPRFMNYGLAPADPGLAGSAESLQATLALTVLDAGRDALGRDPSLLVDVACGRGGTLAQAARRFPAARLLGIDQHGTALAVAREAGALVSAADGLALPLADGAADLVVSVEAMLNLGRGQFLAEAARVLAPGGVVAGCGSFNGPPSAVVAHLEREARLAGLVLLRVRDLTQGVVRACREDAARRRGLLRHAPWPLRSRLAGFAALPGSRTFRAYAEGTRCYYLTILRRPAR